VTIAATASPSPRTDQGAKELRHYGGILPHREVLPEPSHCGDDLIGLDGQQPVLARSAADNRFSRSG
jgi:hypothetical protein